MIIFFLQSGLKNYTFLIFVCCLIGFLVFTYFFVPETKNKTFEEIAAQFSPGDHLEVEETMGDDEDIPPATANEDGENDDHNLVTLNFAGKSAEATKVSPDETNLHND